MFKKLALMTGILEFVLLVSCRGFTYNEQTRPESDSAQRYEPADVNEVRILVGYNVYTIKGRVAADVETMSRQVALARGSYHQFCDILRRAIWRESVCTAARPLGGSSRIFG